MGGNSNYLILLLLITMVGCSGNSENSNAQHKSDLLKPRLSVSEDKRYLELDDGKPFFWLGGTAWGMSEWLTREQVDHYLDDRKEKDFNLVQICLFWGKREDDPLNFTVNPPNAYGFKAFHEVDGSPDPSRPLLNEGGTPQNPNDYWDHVDYIIQAANERNMFVAILPVWGRRYVNAIHKRFSKKVFSISGMKDYGDFLGDRFKVYDNIIWVLGGDVQADSGGNFLNYYRSMAEGIIAGITDEAIKWDEPSELWDYALMTYHPDGAPLKNSSLWFHNDPWLDFNMIETFKWRDSVYLAIQHDYQLSNPVKPTVMGEPAYEGNKNPYGEIIKGIHMRGQAYQSIFGGAAGFTYGGFRDEERNGPLFSPFKGWEKLLDMEGANSMKYVKAFCLRHNWPDWTPANNVIKSSRGEGALQKVAVYSKSTGEYIIYFPENSDAIIDLSVHGKKAEKILAQWYDPKSGDYTEKSPVAIIDNGMEASPPKNWSDSILILTLK